MLKCPTCGKPVDESMVGQRGSTFPFCSDRCKLRDLGKWLSGAYQIPIEPDEDELDETPPEVWVDPDAKKRRR